MNKETILQNKIRVALSDTCVLFRANVGVFKEGDRFISTGLPKGFPDLFGFRRRDGKFLAIEIKTDSGKVSKYQRDMINAINKNGGIAIVARSVEDARKVLDNGKIKTTL